MSDDDATLSYFQTDIPRSYPVPAPDFTLARRCRPDPVQAMPPSVQVSAQHGSHADIWPSSVNQSPTSSQTVNIRRMRVLLRRTFSLECSSWLF